MLSGIGPREDLTRLGIPVVQNLHGVGGNLQDHVFVELVTTQKPGTHHRSFYLGSAVLFDEARDKWLKYQTGPFSDNYLPQIMAYLRSDRVLQSREFQALDPVIQKEYEDKTKPNYELISVSPNTFRF